MSIDTNLTTENLTSQFSFDELLHGITAPQKYLPFWELEKYRACTEMDSWNANQWSKK